MRKAHLILLAALTFVGVTAPAAVSSADPPSYTATFTPGQTDGLAVLSGTVTFTDAGGGNINAQGTISGLQPNQVVVTVPYSDPYCTPLPGVTAYPSGAFQANSAGVATFNVVVNPRGINPVGRVAVKDIKSVSVRRVLLNGQIIGPITVPPIPNVAAVEACTGS